jgi:hypothetical protein
MASRGTANVNTAMVVPIKLAHLRLGGSEAFPDGLEDSIG